VIGDANGGADDLLLLTAKLTVVAATGGDGGDGAATVPKDGRRRRRLDARRDGARRHGRTREKGQTREEITGNIYMSSNRRDRAANVRNQIGKNSDSIFRDKLKPNPNLIQNSTVCFDSWGKRKRRPRGTKPLKNPKGLGSDSAGNRRGKAALGFGSAAAGRRLGTDLTGGPHLSASGRERARARLGPAWAVRGEEREGERSWAGFGPKTKKGEILNFFE
jgi:Domain of unknown function (DUF834).